jgi:gliding-associated putative ABC transporter substrate-binding component GldG
VVSREESSKSAGFLDSRAFTSVLWVAIALVAALMVNQLSAKYFLRLDMTEERRYTLKPATRELLGSLEEPVYVEVFLDGDLNAAFTRLKNAVGETLNEFRVASGNRVHFVFTDPAQAAGEKARSEFMKDLAARGVIPTRVVEDSDGQRSERIVFPGALISAGSREMPVPFLKGNKAASPEMEINQSIEELEYGLARAIQKLTSHEIKRIAWIEGHGEIDGREGASLEHSLGELYDVQRIQLGEQINGFQVALIAKPVRPFSTPEKYWLDQFIMKGGKALFLIDRLEASLDSVRRGDYFALPLDLNLDDLLFRYGVRINMDLLLDRAAALQPMVAGGDGRMQLVEWPFYPLLNSFSEHSVTRNLDAVLGKFASTVDTVKAEGVRKTMLVSSSPYSSKLTAPVLLSVEDVRNKLQSGRFDDGPQAVACLLEGEFTSLFKNRYLPEGVSPGGFRESSQPTAMIVISDGDMARNPVNLRTGSPQPLGFDPASNYTFANEELLLNAVAYLLDGDGLITARARQVKLRPLDKQKVADHRQWVRIINVGLPILILAIVGSAVSWVRRRQFAA